MLHRLVGGTVFADADAVVGENPDRGQVRERRESDRRAHVIGKDEEGCAIRTHAAMICHAVDDCSHGMFAHAKVEVTPGVVIALEGGQTLQPGIVRGSQVGGAANQFGYFWRKCIERFP